jgi:hypothetical protein
VEDVQVLLVKMIKSFGIPELNYSILDINNYPCHQLPSLHLATHKAFISVDATCKEIMKREGSTCCPAVLQSWDSVLKQSEFQVVIMEDLNLLCSKFMDDEIGNVSHHNHGSIRYCTTRNITLVIHIYIYIDVYILHNGM